MSYQVLARKWRPRIFDELVGQEHVSQALINGLDQDRLHHAFLFTGTRGIGKTTIARILAKCLNCETGMTSKPCGECASCVDLDEGRFVDMIEIDAASRTGVDDMRELLESVQYTPTRGRYKIYIIDEVHMLSASSFNALLKTLEEPPPHVKFVLATTDPQKIPVTILSRCLRFNLRRLLPEQIQAQLEAIVNAENIESEPEALSILARAADGSMRDGLSLLDQAIAFGAGRLAADDLEKMLGLIDHEHVASIVRALVAGEAEPMLDIVGELASQSRDLDTVLVNLAETLHRITLVQCAPGYRDKDRPDWPAIEALADEISAEDAQLFYQIAIKGRNEITLAPDPRTGLEMALLRMLAFRPAISATGGAAAGGVQQAPRPAAVSRQETPSPAASEKSAARSEPAAEPAAKPAAPVPAPANRISAPRNNEEWLILQEQLGLKGQVRELARNIEFQTGDETSWTFAISPALEYMGSRACLGKLEQVVSEALGKSIRVRLDSEPEAPLETKAQAEIRQAEHSLSEAEKSIEEDPTVQDLKEKMGARVIDDSVQPIQ